ncbi:polysaccharide deacetylase family protein [Duganella callida]|uniref:Polysaccharide deacetylase family protein n=2 Tax=Duganella callida TaxID=2561932 RepID=A0A4Y9SBC7_9BURK|nr:polysaccharide deacetylase family protein [Duganella callida]
MLGRSLLRPLLRGGRHSPAIMIYHRVRPQRDTLFPDEVDAAHFARQLAWLTSYCEVMPLLDAVRHMRAGTLPPRAACITFDDGYADNADIALPLLQHYRVPATFFVASGFLNGGRMWNDSVIELIRRAPAGTLDASSLGLGVHRFDTPAQRVDAIMSLLGQLKYLPMAQRLEQVERLSGLLAVPLPTDLMMRDEQVRQLHRAGMAIGGHTVHHPILARLEPPQARAEIAEGKAALERLTGAPVSLFAYPNGGPGTDYGPEHVAMVRELGFEAAVSTSTGAAGDQPDLYQLPRFTPWDRSRLRYTLRLARNLTLPAVRA